MSWSNRWVNRSAYCWRSCSCEGINETMKTWVAGADCDTAIVPSFWCFVFPAPRFVNPSLLGWCQLTGRSWYARSSNDETSPCYRLTFSASYSRSYFYYCAEAIAEIDNHKADRDFDHHPVCAALTSVEFLLHLIAQLGPRRHNGSSASLGVAACVKIRLPTELHVRSPGAPSTSLALP